MKSGNNPPEIPDWRIKAIPFNDPSAMMETNWGAIFGTILFMSGIFAGLMIKTLFAIGIAIAVAGLAIGLISILLRGRIARRNWKKVQAVVIDKECKRVLGNPGQNGGVTTCWAFRLLCEFELEGRRFTVTPDYWSTFISEGSVQGFLEKVVSPDGKCQLWVNPKNPLQTELIANDIRDFLLH